MWEEVVEKVGDTKVKANLQPSFYIREIDSRCPKSHHQSAKKDKKDIYQEYRNEVSKDKDKTKSHTPTSTNQLQTQASKKKKRGRQGDYLVTRVNATKIAKKDKSKAKDLSNVEYYTYKQKGHYANKCPEKEKN